MTTYYFGNAARKLLLLMLCTSFLAPHIAIAGPPQTSTNPPSQPSYASVLASKPTPVPPTVPSVSAPITPPAIVVPTQPKLGFWLWTAPHWHYPG